MEALRERAQATAPPPPLKLEPDGFDLIAEVKRAGPSTGALAEHNADIAARVRGYAQAGACAISVLTEPTHFGGELGDIAEACAALAKAPAPVMRKDFLIDPYQVYEARAAGASGVLLIVRMLPSAELETMLHAARECGLFVLLEAFDANDLQRIDELDLSDTQALVGVNTRDLATLEVAFGRLRALAPHLPDGLPAVAESGIGTSAEIEEAVACGYRLALVGSALMRRAEPARLVRELIEAGRRARRAR